MTDTYVALYPYSNTNPTAKFRVVKNEDWMAVLNGEQTTYPFTAYDKYEEAVNVRDRLNADSEKS
jgi:hypothetical protein